MAERAAGADPGGRTRPRRPAVVALVAAAVALAAPVVGWLLFLDRSAQGPDTVDVPLLALGGHSGVPTGVDPELRSFVGGELAADLWLIAGYGLGAILGAVLLTRLTRRGDSARTGRRWALFASVCAVTAVVADLLENLALWLGVRGAERLFGLVDPFDAASVLAVVMFSALVPALVALLVAVVLTVARAVPFLLPGQAEHVIRPGTAHRARPVLPEDSWAPGDDGAAGQAADDVPHRWARAYDVPPCPDDRSDERVPVTGIGLSGGGIRAASVAMGALQSPEFRTSVLPSATHLVSVSGGGYTAGAFQQALTEAGDAGLAPDQNLLSGRPATAFAPGTVEEDHVRRHASYLASSPKELLLALGLLARHLLLTLIVLFGPAVLIGVTAGLFHRAVRLTPIPQSVVDAGTTGAGAPAFPGPRPGAVWALGILTGVALALWLVSQYASAHNRAPEALRVRRGAGTASVVVATLAGVAFMLTVALPAVIWAAAWVLARAGGTFTIGGPIAGVLLTYAASLASVSWRNRRLLGRRKEGATRASAAPRGVVQLLLVVAALLVLAVGWLLVLGGMALVGLRDLSGPAVITLLVLLAVVVFLGFLSDETTLSLHPFYRARLASAFAVRRIRRADGQTVARAYPAEERTSLSRYGLLPAGTPFPHVVFAASATLGEKRTAPGAHRTSYTFCGHWVGGPDVGYVNTAELERLAPPRLQRDLTVQGAVSLSGAAIAASIGGQRTAWYETLFVVTGLRLGAWMPNPGFLVRTQTADRPWTQPGLPRNRRLSYLLRQLFGVHSAETPLLQVTDGGFYDNLGLVELFRRGCTRIYCIDASGDNPPAATALSHALTLAYHELGVETELEGGTWSTFTAGSAEPLSPRDPLAALSSRLSQTGIITGTFTYPEGTRYAGRGTGVLVVAKSSLWPGLPYQLLAHAQAADPFPRDSTGDQFFDDRQYAAYTALGRALGTAAVRAMGEYDDSGRRRPTTRSPAGGTAGVPVARIGVDGVRAEVPEPDG